jgi:two-component system, chemotaxis family, protein-glutamate methylesterase/glutaminase
MKRDIIAIGASAGGVEVLLDLVRDLPADLPASLFIVMHVPPAHVSLLPELLGKRGRLPVRHPLHEEPIEQGQIYVAPPDNHISLRDGMIEVSRGPKENGHRPSVNTLFRTASAAYGSRVVGVVLSGYLDCGTAGMLSIKARGGVSVVQAPESAQAADMPQSVIQNVEVDHVVQPRELGPLLAHLVRTEAPSSNDHVSVSRATLDQLEGKTLGKPVGIVCPICSGALTETEIGLYEHFRCHVGHSFSLASLVRTQGDQMERALWGAIRALEESAGLTEKLAGRAQGDLQERFAEKARTQRAEAALIREVLLRGSSLSDEDAQLV